MDRRGESNRRPPTKGRDDRDPDGARRHHEHQQHASEWARGSEGDRTEGSRERYGSEHAENAHWHDTDRHRSGHDEAASRGFGGRADWAQAGSGERDRRDERGEEDMRPRRGDSYKNEDEDVGDEAEGSREVLDDDRNEREEQDRGETDMGEETRARTSTRGSKRTEPKVGAGNRLRGQRKTKSAPSSAKRTAAKSSSKSAKRGAAKGTARTKARGAAARKPASKATKARPSTAKPARRGAASASRSRSTGKRASGDGPKTRSTMAKRGSSMPRGKNKGRR